MESPVCAHTSARESGTRPTTTQLVHSQIKRKNNNKMEMHCPTSFFLAQSLNVRGNAVLDAVLVQNWTLTIVFSSFLSSKRKFQGKVNGDTKATKVNERSYLYFHLKTPVENGSLLRPRSINTYILYLYK